MRRGPLFMVLGSLLFTGMFAFTKLARAELHSLDVMFWRGVTATPLALLFAMSVNLRPHRPWLIGLRSLFGFGAILSFVYAAKGLLIADISLIYRLQPIAVALIAPLVLGRIERANASLWLVIALSMVGVALILTPGLSVGSYYGLVAFLGALSSALAHITIRALMRSDDPRVVVFYFQFALLIASALAIVLIMGRIPTIPPGHLVLPVLGIGVLSTGGQMAITYGYAADRAAVVAAASYSGVLFAVIADLLVFAAIPGWTVWLGGSLIIVAGLWLLFERDPTPALAARDTTRASTREP